MIKQSNITLRELIDKLIDLEQACAGEAVNGDLPVVCAWPDAAMLRIKDASSMLHTSRIPLFGIERGQKYISLKLA